MSRIPTFLIATVGLLAGVAAAHLPWPVVSQTQAIIGRPLTPLSYAGVARRTTRRTVAYGAAVAAPYGAPYGAPAYW